LSGTHQEDEEEVEEENEDVLKGSNSVCLGVIDRDVGWLIMILPSSDKQSSVFFSLSKNHVRYVTGSSSRLILLSFLAYFELIRCPLHGP
jgi:hypothetical protein